MENERRKEVLNTCLELFVEKGINDTSTRDLSKALQLQNGGLYYYFSTKDELVISCAEEATMRLETSLIHSAIKEIGSPDSMLADLRKMSDEMAPLMKFLASVCVAPRYRESVRPTLNRLSERYVYYAELFAEKLGCQTEEIEPYVYMGITAASNYMIFGENSFIRPQMNMIKSKINEIKERKRLAV